MRDAEIAKRLRASLERVPTPDPEIQTVLRRSVQLRRRRVLGSLVVVVLIGSGLLGPLWLLASSLGTSNGRAPAADAEGTSTGNGHAPTFAPADGWFTVSSDPSVLDTEAFPITWTANVPFAERDLAYATKDGALWTATWPFATIQELGPEDIVVVAGFPLPGKTPTQPKDPLPLQLSSADVQPEWEGQIDPNVPQYYFFANADGRYLEVRIFFGTKTPSQDVLEAAQGALDRLSA